MSMGSEVIAEIVSCPNCGTEGPPTKFCLNCGSLKMNMLDESLSHTKDPTIIAEAEKKPNVTEPKHQSEQKNIDNQDIGMFDTSEYDPNVNDKITELKNSVNMNFWLIDLLLKEEVDEDDFNALFDTYEARLNQSLKRCLQMIEDIKDPELIRKQLNEARLRLSELEQRKKIGDISQEEYNLKTPVFQWDIDNYKKEISKRKSAHSNLDKFSKMFTKKEISEMKSSTQTSKKTVKEQQKSGKLNQAIGNRILKVFDQILSVLKGPK
jgi:hypothetical protein